MGGGESFLKQPNTEKHDFKGKDQRLRYACSEMQGWRNSMEDSHISELNINNDGVSLFGVFDGHGG
jgi:serine/threonine protein phosphatase PrpC